MIASFPLSSPCFLILVSVAKSFTFLASFLLLFFSFSSFHYFLLCGWRSIFCYFCGHSLWLLFLIFFSSLALIIIFPYVVDGWLLVSFVASFPCLFLLFNFLFYLFSLMRFMVDNGLVLCSLPSLALSSSWCSCFPIQDLILRCTYTFLLIFHLFPYAFHGW